MTNEEIRLAKLAAKELKRQMNVMRRLYGDEFDEALAEMRDTQFGEALKNPSAENAEKNRQSLEMMAIESDNPGMIMRLRTETECEAAGLPQIAQFLADDAMKAAAAGVTKETWIAEVLEGHGSDEDATASENEEAQLACLQYILALWTNGPWAWPRQKEGAR